MKIDLPASFTNTSVRSFNQAGRRYGCTRVLPHSVKIRFADSSGRQCEAVIESAAPARGINPAHAGRLTSFRAGDNRFRLFDGVYDTVHLLDPIAARALEQALSDLAVFVAQSGS